MRGPHPTRTGSLHCCWLTLCHASTGHLVVSRRYWLYKLHGLNLEFKCEICGNYSYWGPRPFERHFQEWRHAYGMKCLGIPNSKHFQGITLIEDAYTLWAKLKAEQGSHTFNQDLDEEFEDRQGNVMNRKTYADLARQGLLD